VPNYYAAGIVWSISTSAHSCFPEIKTQGLVRNRK
jgi:hypothetical protein